MTKINTFIIPIITSNNISRCLETLDRHTPDNYNIIVIDQTITNKAYLENHFKTHLWIRSYRNLGFSKAMNTGIKLAQTEYVTLCNDDLEFINEKWWQGIVDTFATDPRILAVNPMSPKEGSFGYGYQEANKEVWLPPDEYVCAPDTKEFVYPKKPDGTGFFYKENFSEDDYQFLLTQHMRYKPGTMVDGLAGWMPVYKKEAFEKLGLLDERFYPGGGEDYDMDGRAYSCAWPIERDVCDENYHWRMVSTAKSWVWHHWSKSRNTTENIMKPSRDSWNRLDILWPDGFDIWAHRTKPDGTRYPLKRVPEIVIDEI